MSKSSRLRFSDVRNAFRLTHECRDLGHDAAAWRRHAIEQLTRFVGAQVGVAAGFRLEPGESPKFILFGDVGWSSPLHRADWYRRYVIEGGNLQASTYRRFAPQSDGLETHTREQFVDDAEWYQSAEFQEAHRLWGLDDLLASCHRTSDPPRLFGFILVRPLGEKRFGERERRLVHLFHHELSRYVGTALALDKGGAVAGLPPRLRQTLECLLEGDSEKQVAARLGLSRHTIHDYVTALYRRLGVSSRPELLGLCLRRRPPDGAGGS
jgi:DNA-binding CsgD family transcriptional regulator